MKDGRRTLRLLVLGFIDDKKQEAVGIDETFSRRPPNSQPLGGWDGDLGSLQSATLGARELGFA